MYLKFLNILSYNTSLPYITNGLIFHLSGIVGASENSWREIINNHLFSSSGAIYIPGKGFKLTNLGDCLTCLPITLPNYNRNSTIEIVFSASSQNNAASLLTLGYNTAYLFYSTTDKRYIRDNGWAATPIQSVQTLMADKYVCMRSSAYGHYRNAVKYNDFNGAAGDHGQTSSRIGNILINGNIFNQFYGIIHEIRIYNRVLSDDEAMFNFRIDSEIYNLLV